VEQPKVRRAVKRQRRTQAERRATAERKLLAAAVRLIAEKGTSRTTLAEIGEAAGYSRTLPGVYFRDKDGLVRAVWDHAASLFRWKMHVAGDRQEGLDAVLGFADVYLTRSSRDPILFHATQVLQTEALATTSEIRQNVATHNRNSERYLRRQLRVGMQRGEINGDVNPKAQAILIMCALRGAVAHWVIDRSIDLGALQRELLRSLRKSLAA
jgi:AcrR family transcriptional regulator